MKQKKIPERYFIYDLESEELDLKEVSQAIFNETEGEIETERHTVFSNGVDQICYIKNNIHS